MTRSALRSALLILLTAASLSASAASLEVTDARIRWLPGELPLAGYMTLYNRNASLVVLTGATSPWFDSIMMHESISEDGQARMDMRRQVDIPPGGTVEFEPRHYHLMMMSRQKEMHPGDSIPVTLHYEDGSSQTIKFEVQGVDGE